MTSSPARMIDLWSTRPSIGEAAKVGSGSKPPVDIGAADGQNWRSAADRLRRVEAKMPQSGLCLVGRTCLDHPEENRAPSVIYLTFNRNRVRIRSRRQRLLPAAPPCYSMRAPTKKLGNKGLPVVHSWPEIRICVKDIVS